MLAYDKFDSLAKDGMVYSRESGAVLKDAREQTLRTAYDHLVVRNRDYRDLFTTRDTFMSPALASVYNVPAVPGWAPYSLPREQPACGHLEPGELPGAAFAPGPQLADAAWQGTARDAAVSGRCRHRRPTSISPRSKIRMRTCTPHVSA